MTFIFKKTNVFQNAEMALDFKIRFASDAVCRTAKFAQETKKLVSFVYIN